MKKIILTAKPAVSAPAKQTIKIKKNPNAKWCDTYTGDRIERGELTRRIKALCPTFQNVDKLSNNDLIDVERGIVRCQVNRLSYLYPDNTQKTSIFINS